MSIPSAPSQIEAEVGRIRELSRKRRHDEALAAAEALAVSVPDNRDVLYLIATNKRCLNRIPEALETLQRLESRHPRFSLLYQERGYCYTTLRDAARAIDAFLRAVNLNPALTASWSMLERLYRLTGDSKNVAKAAEQLSALNELPPEIVRAGKLFSDGELCAAEGNLRAYLQSENHVEALRLLGRIQHQRELLDEAELLLEAACKAAPSYRAARFDYTRLLLDRQKYLEALSEVDYLLSLEPQNRDYLALFAAACVGLGRHQPAIAIYRQLLAALPGSADLHVSLGNVFKTVGQQKEAIAAYKMAVSVNPGFGDAWWSLANSKIYRFSEDEIARMHAEEAAPAVRPVDHWHLCFALGKALEERDEYEESWRFYERGNRLKRAESHYRPEITETNTRKQIEICTAQFLADRAGAGLPDSDPIFIVGLPRSGSTLLEQILASHSQVDGTQELSDIHRIVIELQHHPSDREEPCYPEVLRDLAPGDFRQLGERYMRGTRAFRGDKPFFVDKMPNNFRHLGLIHLILPNARIIDARREPMACCFSNLKQLFARGQEFTYDIEDIARYYRTYLDLMRHWDAVLSGRVLRVWYEDVVEDLEGNVRRMLEFCGLKFEPACIEFYNTERSIRTASSEQVRQPIFRDGLLQWRKYEPWLSALKEYLGDAVIRYHEKPFSL
jgi:tetratricopeptide (TPR) repeat protein